MLAVTHTLEYESMSISMSIYKNQVITQLLNFVFQILPKNIKALGKKKQLKIHHNIVKNIILPVELCTEESIKKLIS